MPEPDSSTPPQAAKRRQEYPIKGAPATPSLHGILATKIAAEGPIRFTDFMGLALYHPQLGYYARETRQVGRGGDFFTSVSVGPLFGNLLARRILSEWLELGSPDRWRIVESGAHDGTLAADILGAIQQLNPTAFAALEYVICEPLPRLQTAQRTTLQPFMGSVIFLDEPVSALDVSIQAQIVNLLEDLQSEFDVTIRAPEGTSGAGGPGFRHAARTPCPGGSGASSPRNPDRSSRAGGARARPPRWCRGRTSSRRRGPGSWSSTPRGPPGA